MYRIPVFAAILLWAALGSQVTAQKGGGGGRGGGPPAGGGRPPGGGGSPGAGARAPSGGAHPPSGGHPAGGHSSGARYYGNPGNYYGHNRGSYFSLSLYGGGLYGGGLYGGGWYGSPFYGYSPYRAYGSGYFYSSPDVYYSTSPPVIYQPAPAAPAALTADQARVQVIVADPEAQIVVEGAKTLSLGRTRYFDSPSLEPGYKYSYKVVATWTQDGRPVSDVRVVTVLPGRVSVVDFTQPSSEALPPPAKQKEAP